MLCVANCKGIVAVDPVRGSNNKEAYVNKGAELYGNDQSALTRSAECMGFF